MDLLDDRTYRELVANPTDLSVRYVPENFTDWIIIDEVGRVPQILNEVHRLIESRHYRFILTGSSARKLRRGGQNLLGGRASTCFMHPLTATELGKDFNLLDGLKYGALPLVVASAEKERYLNGYVNNYLQQEIIQEGISRNVSSFARFLETASFSQGSVLNVSEVAREARVARKVVEDYFCALEDLLIGVRMPVFSRRAKRRLVYHRKFYYFDAGIYRVLRPTGPFDDSDMIFGAALETLLFQNLRAVNDYLNFKYKLYYFRTAAGAEVDFILYGPIGLKAFEVKSKKSVFRSDISGLKVFLDDYPEARGYLIYGGDRRLYFGNIEVWPAEEALKSLPEILK